NVSKLYYFLYKFTYRIDDMTTFNSAHALEKFKKKKLTSRERSFLINNALAINLRPFQPKDNSVFTLLSVAHFRPVKDYHTLFKAISNLKRQGKRIKLFVLGHLYGQNWPYEEVRSLGIEDNI